MSKNVIISIVTGIGLLAGLFWIARPSAPEDSQATPSGNGRLVVSEASFDFGSVSMANGTVHKIVAVKNEGPDAVTIGKISTSCMCTTATFEKDGQRYGPFGMPGHAYIPKINQRLGAGEQANVEIAFDPAAHGPAGVGRVDRSVYLENGAGRPLEIQFTATVTP